MDGREFIKLMMAGDGASQDSVVLKQQISLRDIDDPSAASKRRRIERESFGDVYFIMNLPAIAMEFLGESLERHLPAVNVVSDAFRGSMNRHILMDDDLQRRIVNVICYCFEKTEDSKERIQKRLDAILGGGYDLVSVVGVGELSQSRCEPIINLSLILGSRHIA